jgi:ribosomal protein S12 methylthiotransferase accessory factor
VDELDRDGVPKVVCGAGAHLDPERALQSALLELASGKTYITEAMRGDRAHLQRMLVEPDLVTTMDDHALLNALPEAWSRFDFLYPGEEPISMAEAFPTAGRYRPAPDQLTDLRSTVDRFLAEDLDVLVVDQTAPEHEQTGLHCVKVLIPGTLPMTFGHRNRRIRGLRRVAEMPVRLGYRSTPLDWDDINPHPHPFP